MRAQLSDDAPGPTGAEVGEDSGLPDDERLVRKVQGLYINEDYKGCIQLLATLRPTDNDKVLEKAQYYAALARLRSLEQSKLRGEVLNLDDVSAAEHAFQYFLEHRNGSSLASTVYYWLGQFYLQIKGDKESSLKIFDDIVEHRAYSDWIQGSLYYSGILHHQLGTETDKRLAVERMQLLGRIDRSLRIAETGRDVDAATAAEQILKAWGVEAGPSSRGRE